MAYDLTDRLDEATKQANNSRVTAAPQAVGSIPPTLGNGLSGQDQVAQNIGFVTGTELGKAPAPMQKPGFDQSGIITADSAKSVMADPMQRSGGIAGGIDMQGANAVLARENATRQQMIDAQVGNGTGKPVSWQDQNGTRDPEKDRVAESNALLNKWDKQYQNQQAVAEMGRNPRAAQGIAHLTAAAGHDETLVRGQDLNHGAAMAQQGITARGQDLSFIGGLNQNQVALNGQAITARGQDLHAQTEAQRIGLDGKRLDVALKGDERAADKWNVERPGLVAAAKDSDDMRNTRQGLMEAIGAGDPAAIAVSRAKAEAAGVKFDHNNEFVTTTDSMGMNVTRTNKNTGAVDVIDPKSGAIKAAIPSPMDTPQAAPIPRGHKVVGTSGGKRVLEDAKGNRFIEGGK